MLIQRYSENYLEAGVDEVGRGCLAGPVVAAAVILPPDFFHENIRDSKLIKATERKALEIEIKNHALAYSICEVAPAKIDTVNILQASLDAMESAIENLVLTPDFLIIDGYKFRKHHIPHQTIVKGDNKYLSIAAASILAKVYRDNLMEKLHLDFPDFHWNKNKGYPTEQHRKAILTHGYTIHHRLTFKLKNPKK